MNQQPTLIEEYEVNPVTMLIKPITVNGKICSEIFELYDEFISPFRPTVIVDNSCKYFGSSFQGRVTGTKQLTGYKKKVPITIDPTSHILFMPTSSPNSLDCIWISLEHVIKHQREASNSTRVTFRNHSTHIIPMSHGTFCTQLQRTSHLRTMLMQRLKFDYPKNDLM